MLFDRWSVQLVGQESNGGTSHHFAQKFHCSTKKPVCGQANPTWSTTLGLFLNMEWRCYQLQPLLAHLK